MMTDFGNISHYLEIKVYYILGNKIIFCHSTYLKKFFDCLNIANCKPASFSINPEVANSLLPFDKTADLKTIN